MGTHIGHGVIIELSDGVTKVTLSPEDAKAFTEWQRLKPEEKENLLKLARVAPLLLSLAEVGRWLAGASYLIIRAGAIGTAVLAVLSLLRNFTGS